MQEALLTWLFTLPVKEKNPCSVIDFYSLDDFMELPSDKEKVFNLLENSLNHITNNKTKEIVSDWLNKARSFAYE